jgi:Domain of unknown function (DUF4351)
VPVAKKKGANRSTPLDDFTQSVAYREIFGRGEAKVTLRLLSRRCGLLSAEQDSVIRSLPLERLEAAKALLVFESMADLKAWLAANA